MLLSLLLLLAGGCRQSPTLVVEQVPIPTPVRVRLLFAGDLMQHLPQVQAARREQIFDYGEVFGYVKSRFQEADVAVVNLETTLSPSECYSGYPRFRSPVALADALHTLGVDVVLLANNHCCDGDGIGVRTTVQELSQRGMRHTGVFQDSADYKINSPLYIKLQGVTFALLNYTYSTNEIPVPQGIVVNMIDTVRMSEDMAAVQCNSVDCVVVCMHWGDEYERRENQTQRQLAAFLQRCGADIIVGSHPHVVQPFKANLSHIVLYSLGNFVSNQQQRYCNGGLLAQIDVVKYPDGRMEYELETIPVWVLCPGYRIIPPEVGDTLTMPEWSRRRYEEFREDTRQQLYK